MQATPSALAWSAAKEAAPGRDQNHQAAQPAPSTSASSNPHTQRRKRMDGTAITSQGVASVATSVSWPGNRYGAFGPVFRYSQGNQHLEKGKGKPPYYPGKEVGHVGRVSRPVRTAQESRPT